MNSVDHPKQGRECAFIDGWISVGGVLGVVDAHPTAFPACDRGAGNAAAVQGHTVAVRRAHGLRTTETFAKQTLSGAEETIRDESEHDLRLPLQTSNQGRVTTLVRDVLKHFDSWPP